METADEEAKSGYRETFRALGAQVREAGVDFAAFERPMRVCELQRCRATCCHDGVVLGEEEAEGIRALVAGQREALDAYGWSGGEGDGVVREDGKWRTARRPAEEGELAEDFPAHFPRTRCVFLDAEHRCVLQRLAVDAGRHPWFWKPISCWMHPVLVKTGRRGGRPVITVLGAEEDGRRFASCTPCGREESDGLRASEVLASELEMLGEAGGRDLGREVG